MSIICDGQFMSNTITEFGETLILRKLLSRSYTDEYDTRNDMYQHYSIFGILNFYTQDANKDRDGDYHTGDITLTVGLEYEDYLVVGDYVYYPNDGIWYEIKRIKKNIVGGVTYSIEAGLKKYKETFQASISTTIESSSYVGYQ
jgi:hypothetical protein